MPDSDFDRPSDGGMVKDDHGRTADVPPPENATDYSKRFDQLFQPKFDLPRPDRIGPYRILGVLGQGGMGIVYAAEQKEPIHRRVALKVIKLGMDTREVVARFEAERQALAQLNHPGISKIYDAGATEDGRPFFVMEHVDGLPIIEYCDRHKLDLRARLGLFCQICRGVEHAHHRGIIHRDLKPSNILVTTPDEGPVAKIIDFGVAKATNQRLTEKTVYTEVGRVIGTPAYMSPEQAEKTSEDVDHRSDVYSLGVILYELLVGELPLSLDVQKIAFNELVRRIREEDPPTPSARWTQLNLERTTDLAAKRRTSPAALRSELRGDLDWIAMKAMEKERERRYGSATHLAEDIERFLKKEPVLAGPPGVVYKMKKYVRRHRAMMAATSSVIIALTLGLVMSIWFAIEASRSEMKAVHNEKKAIENKDEAIANAKAARENADSLAQVLRLSDINRLAECRTEAGSLWPCAPEKISNMERWLAKARELKSRLHDHEKTLKFLRERALPYNEVARAKDRGSHPDVGKLTELEEEGKTLKKNLDKLRMEVAAEDKATILSYGNDPAKKIITYYFRHTFDVEDLPKESSIMIRMTMDDGVMVYLNGKEILRENMPEGTVGPETMALKTVLKPEDISKEVPVEFLRPGRNILAAEVHQVNRRSADLRFGLELLVGEKILVGSHALWDYFDSGKNPGAAWKEFEFDASAWPSGPASFGYGFQEGLGLVLELKEAIKNLGKVQTSLEEKVSERRIWAFADPEAQWQHDVLAELVEGLTQLGKPGTGLIEDIEKWLEFAKISLKKGIEDHKKEWEDAIASIRNQDECPRYRGLVIAPQLGLIPIGRDRQSGLWEFAHLQTGEVPWRNEDGKLVLTEETCIVFVLIPGGKFSMGAVKPDEKNPEGSPNVDPQALNDEGPVHEVNLAPFFISKFEMTQGQWLRFTGENPSWYLYDTYGLVANDLRHPVECVSWNMCRQVLERMGLNFPTEAQWEYAARADTTTVWWTGNIKKTLQGAANLADNFCKRNGDLSDRQYDEDLDDGYFLHAPVGSFRPNAFGLHDVVGNVWEWCRDVYGNYQFSVNSGDGERRVPGGPSHIIRGGSYTNAAVEERSAHRVYCDVSYYQTDLGLRPARVITL